MLRYPITLLLLGLVVFVACQEPVDSQEFVQNGDTEPEPQYSSFLSLDAEDADVGFDLDFDFDFNVSDILNTTAIIDTVTEIIEPIGDKIDAVGQQLDAAIAWVAASVSGDGIQEGIQDVVKSIQEPIGQHIDAVLAWVGGEEIKEKKVETEETVLQAGDEPIVQAEEETVKADETVQEKVEEVPVTTEAVEPEIVIIEEVKVVPEEIKITPLPVAAPLKDIDEIVVLVDYDDIVAAMNSPNATVDTIESEPFFVRFFEVFMGKEVEIGVGGASLSPVEDSKKKSQFLSYDAL